MGEGNAESANNPTTSPGNMDTGHVTLHHVTPQNELEPGLGLVDNESASLDCDMRRRLVLEQLEWLRAHVPGDTGNHEAIERKLEAAMTELEELDLISRDPKDPGLKALRAELMEISTRYGSQTGTQRSLNLAHRLMDRAAMLVSRRDAIAGRKLLALLSSCYLAQYQQFGTPDTLVSAIECHARSVSLGGEGVKDLGTRVGTLGIAHYNRFKRSGMLEDIERAIDCNTYGMTLNPEGHPHMLTLLNNLGIAHLDRFERLGREDDMDNAIEFQTRALSLTPEGHRRMANRVNNLGNAHLRRFQQLGRVDDINSAIKFHTHAVSLTPEGHTDRPSWLNNLGNTHLHRFEQLGTVEDIDNAIECQTRAVSLTPEGHRHMPIQLSNLGNAYSCRFEQLGRVEDIDRAIKCQTDATSLTPESHPQRPSWLNNLGNAHFRRFQRLNRVEDLDKAIKCFSHAVSLTPEGHPRIHSLLNGLGNAHRSRFERLGRVEDIDDAIKCLTRAASLTPKGNPLRPARLTNLGGAHIRRFEQLRSVEDINNAIKFQALAVSLTPQGHPDMPSRLNNLGIAHWCQFEQLGRLEDMDNTIEFQTRAVSLSPEGHPHMPDQLNNLGGAHHSRFNRLGRVEDMACAIKYFKKSSQTSTGSPSLRFRAACNWARLASGFDNSDHLVAYRTAMNLVPELIWLGETIGQRYTNVQIIGDTTLKAAAAAIDAQEFDLALEWLEQGRSIVWNQVLQLRNPFDELSTAHPSLAANLRDLSDQIHSASSSPSSLSTSADKPLSLEEAARKHRQLAGQYNTLLEQIRALPGFESFLRPKKTSELLPAVQTGPLVVINVHESRCDALVLLPGKPDIGHVPLPELTTNKIADEFSRLQNSLEWHGVRDRSSSRRPDRSELKSRIQVWRDNFADVLATLWSTVAKPVLEFLNYSQLNTTESLPHITWCTTGTLSLMPLHAAGLYDRPREKLSDYAVSSYAPTIGALFQARLPIDTAHSRLLSVGQEATRGQGRLPGTRLELDAIEACAGSPLHCMRLEGSDATCAAVLDAIEQHDWVHLACHAHQNVHDPTDSGFFLDDGVLSLATITQKSFKNKGLAFLSACQTATGDQKIADEAVHLASGMLMAGYPSVIATMWSVKDSDAPIIAKEVYGRLLKDGKMDHRDAARALHEAVAHLRGEVGDKAFERWAPYIHIGV
ncbi:aromatic di-alanine and TPR containing protein [Ceratobasidium theobromae]|uniref:Aromatic di-alanine and TPR containing protein n=1 Tax=Ceratobasidium theobromae TaxID=1582974 RepID=A0A5N5Q9I6_9AGAM|nr:aromatic di-alanine and TPR containing protein [Ceratobasidium theobromae]